MSKAALSTKIEVKTERPDAAKCENCKHFGKCDPAACRGDDDGPEYEYHRVGKRLVLYVRKYRPDKKRQQDALRVLLNS